MVTFLDPGFHEMKQEEFDGDIKDRPTSLKDIQNWYNTMWVGKITNELEEVLGVEWTVVVQLSIIAYHCPLGGGGGGGGGSEALERCDCPEEACLV